MISASAVFAILASAVIVLGGLVALVRSIWNIAQTLRDNTVATKQLSSNLDKLTASIDGRLVALVARVVRLEKGPSHGAGGVSLPLRMWTNRLTSAVTAPMIPAMPVLSAAMFSGVHIRAVPFRIVSGRW